MFRIQEVVFLGYCLLYTPRHYFGGLKICNNVVEGVCYMGSFNNQMFSFSFLFL
jgi:hypothetical protein